MKKHVTCAALVAGGGVANHCLRQTSLLTKLLGPNARNYATEVRKCTLIPGDGVGPEVTQALEKVFQVARVPIEWDRVDAIPILGPDDRVDVPEDLVESFNRNKIGLKGPLLTPIGPKGHKSLNVVMRKQFDLYVNLRPVKSLDCFKTQYDNVDVVTIRENTQGEFSGIEHTIVDGVVQSIKVITADASTRIAEFAFQYAIKQNKKKVTVVHKANRMKMSDGLFVKCCTEVAKKYPDIQFESCNLYTVCMQLVQDPSRFEVLVTPNLYGSIVSDLCAGMIGGLGLAASGNIGLNGAIFESFHGAATEIAGQDKANPTAMMLAGVMLLKHIGLETHADLIESSAFETIKEGKYLTQDLGGKSTCSEFTREVCEKIDAKVK